MPQVVVSGVEASHMPLRIPDIARWARPPDPRLSEWTIEIADDAETAGARTEIIETARGDDPREHDGEAAE